MSREAVSSLVARSSSTTTQPEQTTTPTAPDGARNIYNLEPEETEVGDGEPAEPDPVGAQRGGDRCRKRHLRWHALLDSRGVAWQTASMLFPSGSNTKAP